MESPFEPRDPKVSLGALAHHLSIGLHGIACQIGDRLRCPFDPSRRRFDLDLLRSRSSPDP